jgi:hypothetical protein
MEMAPRVQDFLARVILTYALLTAPLEVVAVVALFYLFA